MEYYQRTAPDAQGLYNPQREHDACGIGFVVDVKGRRSRSILTDSLTVLKHLGHRGGTGAEPNTGDGAGVLLQMPDRFLRGVCGEAGIALPEAGSYGAGIVFLPHDEQARRQCEEILAQKTADEGQRLLGWRDLPVDPTGLGRGARDCMPVFRQVFIGRQGVPGGIDFERKLYIIRRRAENAVRAQLPKTSFYVASLSARTIVYKGMLTPWQVETFYTDLQDERMETALAMVHSRYSTNTFPSWERAHPNRYIIHNGEINTLRGNINAMHARESMLRTDVFGDLSRVLPVINPDGSDSAMLDNCVEFLMLSGMPLEQAMMLMIPEPWAGNEGMDADKRAFYEFNSCRMEPWDGPAAIGFTDGIRIGAVLDRNGLRPSRYVETDDGRVILASESGVLDIPAAHIVRKERLHPGRVLLIDTQQGRIIDDAEVKHRAAAAHPYREWLDRYLLPEEKLPAGKTPPACADDGELERQQKAFGYTYEDLRMLVTPLARDGVDPVGAMGNDIPLAVLSDRPQMLYDYFQELFAQVTNPPIDALREAIVTSPMELLGSEGNLLEPCPEDCRRIRLHSPFIDNERLAALKTIDQPGFRAAALSILFDPRGGGEGLRQALDSLFARAEEAVRGGANILILSDRGVDENHAPIPALLAVSGVHQYLVRKSLRTRVSLVLETGEPREVHHFACLIGFGASAVNPYLAFETVRKLVRDGFITGKTGDEAAQTYLKAVTKGVVKVLSKMGISTVQSYDGAQIFEAIGLSQQLVDRYFTSTVTAGIGGAGLDELAREARARHERAFGAGCPNPGLDSGGLYQYRREGETHLYNPITIHTLQQACSKGDYELFRKYTRLIDGEAAQKCTLRGLLRFRPGMKPVPLDEVEPVESICRRFKTGAMSFGSISAEAHEAMAIAMNRIGGKSNTGEGGEDPARFHPDAEGHNRCSAIKQVASGRFGVTGEYLVNAQEIQIKMAQGAKPGEGGQLPGRKVYPWVAKVRYSTPGVGLISPPPHHDIYSIEDLKELIYDLKCANPNARISVKLVSQAGVGTVAAGVAKGLADVILISGYDGGTGAAPRTSVRHTGLPWELGLAETQQTLLLNHLRSRVTIETDGKLMTGRDVVVAALLGAEEFGFATAPLVTLGCVMMRVCNMDTCPVGIATQNPELRARFTGDPQHVVNFMRFIAQQVREIMAQLGFRTVDEMVGRCDMLEQDPQAGGWKTHGLDLSPILYRPDTDAEAHHTIAQHHGLDQSLDRRRLLDICAPAIERRERVEADVEIRNTDRAAGTIVGSELSRRYGGTGLPEDTVKLHFHGSAGQSFGAFAPRGVTMTLEGDANDYIGKGLSGAKMAVWAPKESKFVPQNNILVGNVAFYGATSGEAYVAGAAGERFCVRNSGMRAVVEAVGDHGCEYMTGGRVAVLGPTGRNFAAGMSGGVAWVYDADGTFATRCNQDMVDLLPVTDADDAAELRGMIGHHADATGSAVAAALLADWDGTLKKFVAVVPRDYSRMMRAIRQAQDEGLTGDEAQMAAFEANHRARARVSGN